jgi:hypothetical protein
MPGSAGAIPQQTLANGVYNDFVRAFSKLPNADTSMVEFGGSAQQACKLSRWPMQWTWTPLTLGLAIVWGVFTVGLIILLIYRSTLTMHEEESLYLDDASQHMQQEQTELLVKVNRLTIPVWVFGAGSGVLLLVLAGMFIYQGLNAVQ